MVDWAQEPCLFATTIYNNILYGAPEATSDQIYAAAKAANCHSFIVNLPNGCAFLLLLTFCRAVSVNVRVSASYRTSSDWIGPSFATAPR